MTEPRDDPRWQRAHADYLDDEREGESDDDVFARRVKAAFEMRDITKQHTQQLDS